MRFILEYANRGLCPTQLKKLDGVSYNRGNILYTRRTTEAPTRLGMYSRIRSFVAQFIVYGLSRFSNAVAHISTHSCDPCAVCDILKACLVLLKFPVVIMYKSRALHNQDSRLIKRAYITHVPVGQCTLE